MSPRKLKEELIKDQINYMITYVIKKKKISYENALNAILASETYQRLTQSDMYLAQDEQYILQDFLQEISTEQSQEVR
jgi:hypothetical protein